MLRILAVSLCVDAEIIPIHCTPAARACEPPAPLAGHPGTPERDSAERAAGVARIARAVSRSPVSPERDGVRLGRMWAQLSMPMDASRNDKDYHIDDAPVRSMRMRRKVEEELG